MNVPLRFLLSIFCLSVLIGCHTTDSTTSSSEAPPATSATSENGATAVVEVEVLLTRSGKVASLEVISEPQDPFDQIALEVVRQWTFEPPRSGGESVMKKRRFTLNISLGEVVTIQETPAP